MLRATLCLGKETAVVRGVGFAVFFIITRIKSTNSLIAKHCDAPCERGSKSKKFEQSRTHLSEIILKRFSYGVVSKGV